MKQLSRTLLAALLLASVAPAQTLTRATPPGSSPGYLITLEGAGLGSTTHMRFTAVVGGFVGVTTTEVPVLSASATRVTAVMPSINGWVPPGAGSNPFSPGAGVSVVDTGGSESNRLDFYFFEGTAGFLENTGLGTTAGGVRPSIAFDAVCDPPTPGNAIFTPTLHQAKPGALPVLLTGLPGAPLPILDGQLSVSLLGPLFPTLGSIVDANGESSTVFPIPALSGISITMQWAYLDPITSFTQLSNALQANY